MVWAHSTNHSKPLQSKLSRASESKHEVTYLTDLTMPALAGPAQAFAEQYDHLPHRVHVQDATGKRFIDSTQALPLILGAANVPVFVMDDVDLREGAVGGELGELG